MKFEKDLELILLLEELKKVNRQTKVIGTDRRENDAEHSWNISTMALFLEKYSKFDIDINKVIRILLIHDLVEIFAGDTFAFDRSKNVDKKQREILSMEKIMGYLDDDRAEMLNRLWIEFEEKSTNESKFANAMDRLHPIIANIHSPTGGTWAEHGVELSQVLERAKSLEALDESVFEYINREINKAVELGYIKNDRR